MAAYCILRLALLLLSMTSQQVLAARQLHRHTISVQSLLSSPMCSSPSPAPVSSRPGAAGSTLQIVHRACLETGDDKTVLPDHHDYTAILRRDGHRVRSIHRRLTGAESATATATTTIPARLGLAFESLEYVVTVGIGTPPRNLTVLFDTGSDLTWVQCLPCPGPDSCYPQVEPLFNPRESSTYADVPCGAPACQIGGAQQTSCGAGATSCQYSVEYGDNSETRGDLAKETFTLLPSAPSATGVVFGCSHEYTSGFNDTDMAVAGLLGLGRGDSSILSQTRRRGNSAGVFSYCLPPRGSSTGYLTIGDAPRQLGNLSFTPLITDSDSQLSSMYVVSLVGVSVDGVGVPIPASAFSLGAVIDSGTVVTHMPAAAYYPLRDAFRRHMGMYRMLPEGSEVLDTCYDVTGQDVVTVPRVALEFGGGARIDVDASGVLLVFPVEDDSGASLTLACLAFAPTKSSGHVIVGNVQQRAYNVVFDVDGGRIGFGPNGCS